MTLMKKWILLLFQLTVFFHLNSQAYAQNEGCRIVPRDDVPSEKQPVYLRGGELARVERGKYFSGILVSRGDILSFACPGDGNHVVGGDQVEEGVCVGGNLFRLRNREMTVKEITCSKTFRAKMKQTSLSCARDTARIVEVGFPVSANWYKVFEICHDYKAHETVYSHHTVEALLSEFDEKNSKRPEFAVGIKALIPNYSAEAMYKQQDAYINTTFPKRRYWVYQVHTLEKGHLAPDGDFMLTNLQFATYYYSNAAPQWGSINRGNWLHVEDKVRKLASCRRRDLEVWTGISGVLELPEDNEMREVRLGKMAVPLYFWKLALDPATGAGIVFVSENDPFQVIERPPPCPDICESYGYYFSKAPAKGRIYCCEVNEELKYVIPGLPDVFATDVIGSKYDPVPKYSFFSRLFA